jgi:hypothetical protein
MRLAQELLACTAVAMLLACGVSRAPLPPSLHLPQPVQNLEVSRKGDKVTLTWQVPEQSTDQEPLRSYLGVTRICREVGRHKITLCVQPIAVLQAGDLPKPQLDQNGRKVPAQARFAETLTKELQRENADNVATYVVEILNRNGRSAGVSNSVEIPLAPIPDPPSDISLESTADAMVLRFSPPQAAGNPPLGQGPTPSGNMGNYRVYRTLKGANNFVPLGFPQSENGHLRFDDKTFEWESTYDYRITPITWTPRAVELEGEDSKLLEVFTHDTFAPATPTGLQAVSSGTSREKFIDLTWAPNTESDLAGYNLYRREDEGRMTKLNTELITTPSFRDENVQSGARYVYAVSAVDLRRNESPLSLEAAEVVP